MKILIADKFPDKYQKILSAKHEISYGPELDADSIKDASAVFGPDIIIVRSTKVNAAAIDANSNLKLIIRAGAGYDTIDVAHAKAKGVGVCNCPGTNSIAVAELTLALILALDRKIYDNVADFRAGKWNKNKYSKASGLYGRTLGILGFGNIGREVAKRAIAFGLKVLVVDNCSTPDKCALLGAEFCSDAFELARRSDIISVHLPNTAQTKCMFNKVFFDAMNPGAVFINTSRGELVVEADLIEACNTKGILAGLDVFAGEPDANAKEFSSPLAQNPNIYATHHIGASTDQAQESVSQSVVSIIETYASSGTFLNQVNK